MANGENNEVVNPEAQSTMFEGGLGQNNPLLNELPTGNIYRDNNLIVSDNLISETIEYDNLAEQLNPNRKKQKEKFGDYPTAFVFDDGKAYSENDIEQAFLGDNWDKGNIYLPNGEYGVPKTADDYVFWANTKTNSNIQKRKMNDLEYYHHVNGFSLSEEAVPLDAAVIEKPIVSNEKQLVKKLGWRLFSTDKKSIYDIVDQHEKERVIDDFGNTGFSLEANDPLLSISSFSDSVDDYNTNLYQNKYAGELQNKIINSDSDKEYNGAIVDFTGQGVNVRGNDYSENFKVYTLPSTEYADGNINEGLQDKLIRVLSEDAKKDIKLIKDDGTIDVDIKEKLLKPAYKDGEDRLVEYYGEEADKYFKLLDKFNRQLKNGNTKGYEKTLSMLDEIREDLNLAERLYDPITNKEYSIKDKNIPIDILKSHDKSIDLAATKTSSDLNDMYLDSRFRIKAYAENVVIPFLENEGEEALLKGYSITERIGDKPQREKDIKEITELAKKGDFKDLTFMAGNHPVAAKFNELLRDMTTIERAVVLNEDPVRGPEEYGGSALTTVVYDLLGLNTLRKGDADYREATRTFNRALNRYDKEYTLFDDNGNSILSNAMEDNVAELVLGDQGVIPLMTFIAELTAFRKLSGNKIKKATDWTTNVLKRTNIVKNNKWLGNSIAIVGNGLREGTEFAVVGDISSRINLTTKPGAEQNSFATFRFGSSLGIAGETSKILLRNIPAKNIFSPLMAQLAKSRTFTSVQQSGTSAVIGATTFEFANIMEDVYAGKLPSEIVEGLSMKHFSVEVLKMWFAGGSKNIFGKQGLYRAAKQDIIGFKGQTIGSNNAAKFFYKDEGYESADAFHKEYAGNKENGGNGNKIESLFIKRYNQITTNKTLSTKEKLKQLKELRLHITNLQGTQRFNLGKQILSKEKGAGEEFNPSDASIYVLSQKLKKGDKLKLEDYETLANTPEGIIISMLGLNPKSTSARNILRLKQTSEGLVELFNSSILKTPYKSSERQKGFDFLEKRSEIEAELDFIKNKLKSATPDSMRLIERRTELEAELKEYKEGGEKYETLMETIQFKRTVRYDQKLKEARDRNKELGVKEEIFDIKSKDKYEEKYKELFPNSTKKNVKDTPAFIDNDGNRYLNRQRALEVGNTETIFHEDIHFWVKDSFKTADGKVTKEGIELIDDFLLELTPRQRRLVQKRIDDNYRYNEKGEENKPEDYYEEYLTVSGELMSQGKISYKENMAQSLQNIINPLRSFLPNLKKQSVQTDGKNMFEMIKGLAKNPLELTDLKKYLQSQTPIENKKPKGEAPFSKETPLEAINNLIPKTVKTQEDFKNPRVFNEVFRSLINEGGVINNYIRSRATSREAADKAIESVQDRLLNFDPNSTRKDGSKVGIEGFGEFIFANTRFGKMDAAKQLAKESEIKKQQISITKETEQIITETETAKTEAKTKPDPLQIKVQDFTGVPKDLSIKSNIKPNLNFGEVGKEYAIEIANQVFGPGVGAKIMKGEKNLVGETARAVQQYYAKGRNLELSLKTLPEYNVSPKASKIGLETLDVSMDVQGRSIKLPGRFLDYFMEDFVDPTGVMTTPGGRSKGKATQPFVKKLKEEFYKVTPELVKKVGKDIGITKPGDPNLIVDAQTRTEIGGILKGMAKVDMMKLANIQYRIQRAEQGASKQELADAAAGKRDAQFSEQRQKRMASIEEISGGPLKGTKTKKPAQIVSESFDKMIENDYEIIFVMNHSSLTAGYREYRQKRKNLVVSPGTTDPVTLKMIKSGEIIENNFVKKGEQKSGKSINQIKKENPDITIALRGQSKYDLDRNFATREQHISGNVKLIEKFEKAFNIDPIATRILLYNQNANNAATKKMAQMVGIELGIDMKFVREEHMLQHGSFIELMFETFSLKGESKKAAQRFLAESYVQIAIEGKQKGPKSSEKIIDGTYSENRFTGEKAPLYIAQHQLHPAFRKAWDKAKQTGDWSKLPDPGALRSYNEYFYLNPNKITREGVTDAKRYDVEVDKKFQNKPNIVSKQAELIYLQEIGEITSKVANKIINEYVNKLAPAKFSIVKKTNKNLPKELRFTEEKSLNDIIKFTEKLDKAMSIARDPNAPKKGISVFDFDDTLARTKSKVRYEMPDGTEGVLNATQFAKESSRLEKDGAIFDFSDFNKVVGGKKGPLFELAQKREGKFTNKDIFVLTARPQLSAAPIHMFLKSQGLNIPIENIKGLEDGSSQAKARWIIGKAAEGYNDFYFADDAYKNVKAVQKALNIIDVKSDVQQAKFSKEKNLNKDINSIIEYATGIGKEKTYSKAKAEISGKGKGNWSIYMPNRAGDFYSLTNALLGKGKKGLENREWFKENLSKPFSRGDLAYQTERRIKMADYFALKKQLKDAEYEAGLLNVFKKNPLKKPFEKDSKWTNEHAVRVYNWNKQNILPKDISKSDVKKLVNHVNNNPKLKMFAENLAEINKQDGYPAPKEFWVSETITQDILTGGENVSRKRHMKEFIDNANIIFSPENLNKMEAALGPTWRRAMEDALERMKTGTNRPSWARGNKWEADMLDFMNGSISGIMFLNVRSAILQQVSIPNYINVTDNNPFKAAKAFANFPQFAKDYVKLMNDEWSLNRRDGLRYNIQESEIVEALSRSKNKGAAIIDYALKKGFVLTKYADSHATAFGGASLYRNRLNTYKKKGLSEKEAEEKALEDWREASDATQQTSRMDRVSQEQKSVAGRLILPFTSVQLAYGRRYIDDPGRDLLNGRYDGLIKGENSALKKVGQIVYGTVIQGAIFHALQQGVFKVLFEDGNTLDGEELEVANATLDGILVGSGIRGKFLATFKNWLIKAYQEGKKENPRLRDTTSELLKFTPPIDKKYRQIRGALATIDFDKDEMSEISLDNPGLAAIAGLIEAGTNAPTDRLLRKMQNVEAALEEDRANWQRPFLLGGWAEYDFEDDDMLKKYDPKNYKKRKRIFEDIDKRMNIFESKTKRKRIF